MLMQYYLLLSYDLTVQLETHPSELYSLKFISSREQALCPCRVAAQQQYLSPILV